MQTNAPKIIVGVDSTGGSTAAVDWAMRAASAQQATLRILHGFSPDQPGFSFGMDTSSAMIRTAHGHMLDRVAKHARAFDTSVLVETLQSDSYPAKMLVRASADASLVVVGVQGDSHLGFSSVGQTAAQVASHAQSPVAIVRGGSGEQHPYGVVTVGMDLSPAACAALERAFDEAERAECTLSVVYAWQPRDSQDPHLRRSNWADYTATCEQRVRESLEDQQRTHPDVKVTVEVTRGNPTRVLADRSESSDLLVVGARGSGGFDGLRLGQVARDLITHAHCTLVIDR